MQVLDSYICSSLLFSNIKIYFSYLWKRVVFTEMTAVNSNNVKK